MSALCVGPCRPPEHGGPRQTGRGGRLCDVCRERMWEHLHAIAETWDDLVDRLAQAGSSALSETVTGSTTPGLVLNEVVSDTMNEIGAWVTFVARVVIDEREVSAPKDVTTPALLRWLASTHVDWLATHHDEQLVADLSSEAARFAKEVRRRAFPSGGRVLDMPWLLCTDHVPDNDEGKRVACPGHMRAWVMQGATTLPDLVCSDYPEHHRVDPATWQRQGWKRATFRQAGTDALVKHVFGESLA